MGTLYIVATPIGNLADITLRALRVLRGAHLIAAEDTRTTNKLLARYQIDTPLISYHEHNKLTRLERIFQALESGDVALVSDAGTPGLSDPGYELVREAIARGVAVSAVPGPTALVAALVVSGLPCDSFVYVGFVPRAPARRRTFWEGLASEKRTLVTFEAPHRLRACLQEALRALGDREIAVARELTKLHEEVFRGTISEALERFAEPRGEVTLVIAGAPTTVEAWPEERVRHALEAATAAGASPAQAARQVAATSGWSRRAVYRLTVEDG
jgi:16S rRNA (cytidine1402-2'-O)-methyltransferase